MKSITQVSKQAVLSVIAILSVHFCIAQKDAAQLPEDPTKIILYHDSAFWAAYNVCDVAKMSNYFTEDLEFYHDKNGFTSSKATLEEAVRTGLCSNPNWQLRREEIKGTVKVFPMNNYGALITGEHLFYINEGGKPEYLDGYGKFTHLWNFEGDVWKMSRIISYDHGPPPFINNRREVPISKSELERLAGNYSSSKAAATITAENNCLRLVMGDFQVVMVPESSTTFFVKERDLQFDFILEGIKVKKLLVYEKGNVVDELSRR
jgi:hypothetical protein